MSGLTEQFVVLLMFSCFFALCEETLKVTVKTGEDATLQCRCPTDDSITLIEWSRPDLESGGYVFFFRENQPYENYQLPSFHGRVKLRDPEMKDGDASVILKNVNINDTGTYECFVRTRSSGRTKRNNEYRQSVALKVTQLGTKNVTAKTGEDVTLQCQKDTDVNIILIEWNRPDLESNLHVFYFRENKLHESYQHPSFHGRVELRDPEMKNGDASVILKNVTVNDTGTYECDVVTGGSGEIKTQSVFSRFINLKVTESGEFVVSRCC